LFVDFEIVVETLSQRVAEVRHSSKTGTEHCTEGEDVGSGKGIQVSLIAIISFMNYMQRLAHLFPFSSPKHIYTHKNKAAVTSTKSEAKARMSVSCNQK